MKIVLPSMGRLLEIWHYKLALMSIYECTMVDSEKEPTPDVRYPNVEMVNTKRAYSRCKVYKC